MESITKLRETLVNSTRKQTTDFLRKTIYGGGTELMQDPKEKKARMIVALEESWGRALDSGRSIYKKMAMKCAKDVGGETLASLVEASLMGETEGTGIKEIAETLDAEVLESSPKLKEFIALAYLARALERMDKKDYARVVSNCDKIMELGVCVLSSIPTSLEEFFVLVYTAKASAQKNMREYDAALASIENVFELNRQGTEIDPVVLSQAYYIKYQLLYRLGGLEAKEALLEALNEAIKLNPQMPVTYLLERGAINMYLHNWDDALKDLDKVLEREPTNMMAAAAKMTLFLVRSLPEDKQESVLKIGQLCSKLLDS